MRRSWKYIAGASAVVLVAIGAAELRRSNEQPEGEAVVSAPPGAAGTVPVTTEVATEGGALVAGAAPMPAPPAETGASAEALAARIDELTARLADREAELATMTATLAERDASLDTVTATLSRREAEIQTLRDELASLRDELASLRERYAFDIKLEELKGRPRTLSAADRAGEAAPDAATVLAVAPGVPVPGPADVLALTQIQFESGSSRLTPGGQVHAAAAAVMLTEMSVERVRLLGYADRVGRADRNRALAAARARAVADFLVGNGVPAAILEAEGMGEDDLPVATGDGVAEPLNRSVAILAVASPTS